jgi:cutinase
MRLSPLALAILLCHLSSTSAQQAQPDLNDPLLLDARGFGLHSADLSGVLSGLSLPSAQSLLNTSLTVLIELLTTLQAGQLYQNGLVGVLGANMTTATATDTTVTHNGKFNHTSSHALNTTCPRMAIIFARGTTEPGNVGFLTGPPFFTAVQNYFNGSTSLAIQGVDYPATAAGFVAGGSPIGASVMAALADKTAAACPDAVLVLSGYSQGAQVVHLAAAKIANTTASKVSSVVLFGDPRNGTAVQGIDAGRVLTVCHDGDNICQGGDVILPAHLNYSSDAPAAAMFVMQKSALGLTSQDAMMQGMGNVPMMQNPSPGQGGGSLGKRWLEKKWYFYW